MLPPLTVLILKRLWPHARKQGHERGDILRVGYYCKDCGGDTIWLVDKNGKCDWTADKGWVEKHFEVVELSKERSFYGKGRPKIERLTKEDMKKYKGHNQAGKGRRATARVLP